MLTTMASVAAVLGLPYALALTPPAPGVRPPGAGVLAVGVALQVLLTYGVVRLGLRVGPALGLAWPPAPGWDAGGEARRRGLLAALGLGGALGGALALAGLVVRPPRMVVLHALPRPGAWASTLASVSAGVTEELWFRLGAMALVGWLGMRLLGGFDAPARVRGAAPPALVWGANVVAAVLFGSAHLPQAAGFVVVNGALVAYVLGANGIVGLACGWLYWRRGLVAAMACHAAVDLVAKVLLPAVRGHG